MKKVVLPFLCLFLFSCNMFFNPFLKGVGEELSLATTSNKNSILVYVTYVNFPYDYSKNRFNEELPSLLEVLNFSVDVTDRQTTPQITNELLSNYDQLWILSTEGDSIGCFSAEEIDLILNFRKNNKGLLIAADHANATYDYTVDANQVSVNLGITFTGYVNHGNNPPTVLNYSNHPLFLDVNGVVTTASESAISVTGSGNVVASHSGYNMIAVYDDSLGRVVFDTSFARFYDNGISCGDTAQYVINVANWLARYTN